MAKTRTETTVSPYPQVGAKAPAFTAVVSGGRKVKLADFAGKVVTLYFYPKDDTPGCTIEACGFRDHFDALKQAGVEVVGVSPDSPESHEKFAGKFSLPFTLLADEDNSICQAYGVWQEKNKFGRTYMGVARTTFVIDKEGRIAHVFEKVKPDGHEQEVLEWVKANLE
jgi:thioredoxin-dependent peroxiredoxin